MSYSFKIVGANTEYCHMVHKLNVKDMFRVAFAHNRAIFSLNNLSPSELKQKVIL